MRLIGGDPNLINEINIPDFYRCKITNNLLIDPVLIENGYTFEKEIL